VEKNADLITRCITYNYTDAKLFKEYNEELKKLNTPKQNFFAMGKNKIVSLCLDKIVENLCSSTLIGIAQKAKKFVVSYLIFWFFGITLMSAFSVVTALVELPVFEA
jgi:hypothetical protein